MLHPPSRLIRHVDARASCLEIRVPGEFCFLQLGVTEQRLERGLALRAEAAWQAFTRWRGSLACAPGHEPDIRQGRVLHGLG